MSTIEYVAVVLLVSLVLAVGGAQIAGVDVAEAVGRKIKVALCVVAGDDCDASGEERACVVASHAEGEKDEVLVVVGSGENGYTITRERLSNGRYRVHMVQRTGGAAGTKIDVDTNVLGQNVDLEVGGKIGGAYRYGQTFEADSAAEADALAQKLKDQDHDVLRVFGGAVDAIKGDEHGAVEQFIEINNGGQASVLVDALGIKPAVASLLGGYGAGLRRYHRTDELGLYLKHELAGSVEVSAALASAGLQLGGELEAEVVLSNGFVPHALVLRGTGEASAKASTGRLDPLGGSRAEFTARLDLTQPPLDEPARRLIDGDVGAFAQLMRELPTAARVDVRFYDEDHDEDSSGPNFMGAGFKTTKTTDKARLTAAYAHDAGASWGDWERTCAA